jgi:C_GCAxxG_C_C family probable redox protein
VDKVEAAVQTMKEGRGNCGQVILGVYAPELDLSPDTAFCLAQGLGAGMGRTDGLCGAVNSAVLVIGLKVSPEGSCATRRDRVYAMVQEFMRVFTGRYGSTGCTRLLGCNLATTEGRAEARKTGICDRVCPEVVASAITILEDMFKEPRNDQS